MSTISSDPSGSIDSPLLAEAPAPKAPDAVSDLFLVGVVEPDDGARVPDYILNPDLLFEDDLSVVTLPGPFKCLFENRKVYNYL